MNRQFFTKIVICIIYVSLPLLAFSYKFFIGNGVTKYLYDIVILILGMLSFFVLIGGAHNKLTTKAIPFIFASITMFSIILVGYLLKVNDGSSSNSFYILPFVFEMKLPLYLLIIGFAHLLLQPIKSSIFVDYSRIFSYLVIVDVVIRFFVFGGLVRPSIVSESNYDGVFILLGLCVILSTPKTKSFLFDYALFSIATVLTQSKTGLGCLIILSFIHFATPRNAKYLVILFILLFLSFFIVESRLANIEDASKIDRFSMWFSFIDLVSNGDLLNVLLGYVPGFSIKDSDRYLWWFIENQSEKVGAQGLHAFNYHSLWLRLASTYGVVFAGFIILYFINFARKGKPYLYFSILVLLQGFSMGMFYLSVNLLVLCLYYTALTSGVIYKKSG